MKNIILVFTVLALFSGIFIACDEEDIESVIASITIDADSTTFISGDTVCISISAEDNEELHTIVLSIYSDKLDSIVEEYSYHSHSTTYSKTIKWKAVTHDHSDFVLTLTATDHNGNEGIAKENIHVHPSEHMHEEGSIKEENGEHEHGEEEHEH